MIPFNKPFLSGKEIEYIQRAVASGKISGDGYFTRECQNFFERRYSFSKCLLTTSCTDALEMAAILIGIEPGDEVIMPSYTFVSTANAFVIRGAKIVFIDSRSDHPGMDETQLESLITSKTKAIVPVHYAGMACNMDEILKVANQYKLAVIEDAAQAIDSYYKGKPLGGIGHLAAFSFHETKNIISGEGGMLVINDPQFIQRAQIIWEKGTNRSAFFRGETDKYGWVDIGSSFLPSEIVAAFLFAQLEKLQMIQIRRKEIWERYYTKLMRGKEKNLFGLPKVFEFGTNNYHLFYVICKSLSQRTYLIDYLKKRNIVAVFHYQSLHESPYYTEKHDGRELKFSNIYSDCLVRLPFYFELTVEEQDHVVDSVLSFFYQ